MGAYLSQPITDKESTDESNDFLTFGASSMQGWRMSQEDAHNSILDFDKNASFFAVYDGHGGSEVANYCAQNLPKFLKIHEQYVAGNYEQALREAFIDFDGTLIQEKIIEELKKLMPEDNRDLVSDDDDDDTENLDELCEEGHMPLSELLLKYKEVRDKAANTQAAAAAGGVADEADVAEAASLEGAINICSGSGGGSSNSSSSTSGRPARRSTVTAAKAGGSSAPATDGEGAVNEAGGTAAASEASDNAKEAGANGTAAVAKVAANEAVGPAKAENGRAKAPAASEDDDTDDTDDEEYDKTKVTKAGVGDMKKKKKAKTEDSDEDSNEDSDADSDDDDDDDDDDDEDDDDDDDDVPHRKANAAGDDEVLDMVEDEEDESFLNNMEEGPGSSSGCTAVVALLVDRELYVANAGDSRCVVCRNDTALEMSFDHKPEDEAEQQRIEKAGGRVTLDGRVNGGLNLSRAIGDHAYKTNNELKPEEQMISALPDVKHITISPEDEFMIIACDGIWNFMTSQQVIDFVRIRINDGREKMSTICEELFTNCLASNTMGDGTGCDNMTAVIVRFKPALHQRPVQASKKRCASSPTVTPESEKAKRIKTGETAEAKSSDTDVEVAADATDAETAAPVAAADEEHGASI